MIINRRIILFDRIKSLLRLILNKKTLALPKQSDYEKNDRYRVKANELKENLKVLDDDEEIRLIKIQEKLKSGELHVEKLDEIDFEKICNLYDRQIKEIEKSTKELKESTINYKNKIIEIRKKLK